MNENDSSLAIAADLVDLLQVISQLDTMKKKYILAALDAITIDSSGGLTINIP